MRSFGRARVLVCDDEESVQAVCQRALVRAGYECDAVGSGRAALKLLEAERFDAVLLDVRMPEMDGPHLLANVRERDPDVPCVVMSGFADFESAVACLRLGAAEFVKKPFGLEVVVRAVDRVLASSHLKVENALLAATQTIFSSLDRGEILKRVLRVISSTLIATESAVALLDGDAAAVTALQHDDTELRRRIPESGLRRLLELREPIVLSSSVPQDAELLKTLAPGATSVVVQRLALAERVLGVLWAARHRALGFGDGDMRRAMLLAGHVALALDNARLFSEVNAQKERLEKTIDRLIVAERVATAGRLASGLGHEVANPAMAVQAFIEVAQDLLGAGDAAHAKTTLDNAALAARAILDVCRALRPLSPGSNPRVPIDLRSVVDSATLLAMSELRSRASVNVSIPDNLPVIFADPAKLGQVFLNLFLNAAEALGRVGTRGATIQVRAVREPGGVLVRVEDSGPGVPPDQVPHLFEPSGTSKADPTGHGMGLAICRWILEELGGSIGYVAGNPGAIFEIRFKT